MLDGALNPAWPWLRTGARDYLSASLLNNRPRIGGGETSKDAPILNTLAAAVVISPRSKLRCAYPQDGNTLNWHSGKVPEAGCGPRMCRGDVDLHQLKLCKHGDDMPCALPPRMFDKMLQLFEAREDTIGACAYTEVIIALDGIAFDALVGFPQQTHDALLHHFGLNAHQLPNLNFASLTQGQQGMLFV